MSTERPEFSAGEEYRLGFVVRRGVAVRDDWTGLVVELVEPWAESPGFWRCRRNAQTFVVVPEERLRSSARLPSNG